MNALVPQNFGQVSQRFAAQPVENDLSAGVQAGFGIIGYRGKVWSTRYRGEEKQLMRPDGDGPRNSIEVVIVKASGHVSKIWYKDGFVEGSSAAPDCYSTNGVTPDVGSKNKQHTACASCPMNQWGSRITPAGKQGKACSDSKRLAVVPSDNIGNEILGGPMLLRVPAASLRDLAGFGEKMQARNDAEAAQALEVAKYELDAAKAEDASKLAWARFKRAGQGSGKPSGVCGDKAVYTVAQWQVIDPKLAGALGRVIERVFPLRELVLSPGGDLRARLTDLVHRVLDRGARLNAAATRGRPLRGPLFY